MVFSSELIAINMILQCRPSYLCYFLQLIQHCMFMQEKADPLESIDWMYIFCNLGSYIAMIND